MKSTLFQELNHHQIEGNIRALLNSQVDYLSARSIDSPRAAGDAIQSILAENAGKFLAGVAKEYSTAFARRAMADLAFSDNDGYYYVVDVKTHRKEAGFHMPNLTSVERLARFYEDDSNYFVILFVEYAVSDGQIAVSTVYFVPIEFLSWKCLTLGALGWGQIQIADANRIEIAEENSRRVWMVSMCDALLNFYPREIAKINMRIEHFQRVREYWTNKAESFG